MLTKMLREKEQPLEMGFNLEKTILYKISQEETSMAENILIKGKKHL
jgi:hypothetical protein